MSERKYCFLCVSYSGDLVEASEECSVHGKMSVGYLVTADEIKERIRKQIVAYKSRKRKIILELEFYKYTRDKLKEL